MINKKNFLFVPLFLLSFTSVLSAMEDYSGDLAQEALSELRFRLDMSADGALLQANTLIDNLAAKKQIFNRIKGLPDDRSQDAVCVGYLCRVEEFKLIRRLFGRNVRRVSDDLSGNDGENLFLQLSNKDKICVIKRNLEESLKKIHKIKRNIVSFKAENLYGVNPAAVRDQYRILADFSIRILDSRREIDCFISLFDAWLHFNPLDGAFSRNQFLYGVKRSREASCGNRESNRAVRFVFSEEADGVGFGLMGCLNSAGDTIFCLPTDRQSYQTFMAQQLTTRRSGVDGDGDATMIDSD